jgi:DNA-binding transcriptional ArsR family regulator
MNSSARAETTRPYAVAVARIRGDADIAHVAAAIAEPTRARILLALVDGRALPASLLAAEAGVSASTTSEHLRTLVSARLVTAHPQGRHRYYRLARPEVADVLEGLSQLAPPMEIRSLRDGTRASALRSARTCYGHLAGRLGVSIFRALLDGGSIVGGDGVHRLDRDGDDRLAAPGRDVAYRLTPSGRGRLARLGVRLPRPAPDGVTPLRYCIDWTEQRHHLSGAVGRALADRLFELGWIERRERTRAVRLSDEGERRLQQALAAPPGAVLLPS